MFRKNKLAMLVGEFLGTGALTLAVLALSHSSLGQLSFFVAMAAGLMYAVMVLALGGITGAIFNPALTIGLWTVRKIQTAQALLYIVVQFLGAAAAWGLFAYFAKLDAVGYDFNMKYSAPVLVAEVLGAFIFSFAVAAALYQRFTAGTKSFTLGAGYTLGAVVATLGSVGIVNPAVAFAMHQFGWGTYVLGPILGAVLGFNLYNMLFVETEVAEAAEARAEATETRAVARPVRTNRTAAPAKKSTAAKRTTTRKKTTAKK